MTHPTYRTVDVDGFGVFCREAGDRSKPTLLLLHGFPTSSHMFRDLIPLLAGRFHLVAPDLPGFGLSALPSRSSFAYTFDNLARIVGRFTDLIGLDRFALYIFDYGAPTGLRMAMAHPARVTAIRNLGFFRPAGVPCCNRKRLQKVRPMLRFLACAALLLSASPCFAQSVDTPAAPDGAVVREDAGARERPRDPFVISSDACGASRYAHLVGRGAEGPQPISLPRDANVFTRHRISATTLEYAPGRLNIVLDDAGRVVSVGCS